MAQRTDIQPGTHTHGRCQNCSKVYEVGILSGIRDLHDRIEAGEVVPIGECPDESCAALCTPFMDESDQPHVVIKGNPGDGYEITGPFETSDAACESPEFNDHDGAWILALNAPGNSFRLPR